MAIIFPTDPAINDEFTLSGKTWRWDGSKWNLVTIPLVLDDFLLDSDLGELEVDLVPKTDNTFDLGSASLKWKDLYLSGDTIYLGDLVLKETEEGGLGVFGSDGATPVALEIAEGSITDTLLSDDEGQIKDKINNVESRLDTIEGDDETEGSIAKALEDAKAYTDSATIGAIDDIGDVVVTSPQDGESLVYDDGLWINAQVSGVQNIDAGLATTVFSVADINIDGGNS